MCYYIDGQLHETFKNVNIGKYRILAGINT
jgi:hypothetical protein